MDYICEKCGNKLAEDAMFCSKCGAKVSVVRCPNCGNRLPEDSSFCTYCGTKIEAEQVPQQQIEIPAPEAVEADESFHTPQSEPAQVEQEQPVPLQPVPSPAETPAQDYTADTECSETLPLSQEIKTVSADLNGNPDIEDISNIRHYHLTRRKVRLAAIWLAFSTFEEADIAVSDDEVTVSDHLWDEQEPKVSKFKISDFRQIFVGRVISVPWLCAAMFFTWATLLCLASDADLSFKSSILLFGFTVMSWVMAWYRKIIFYFKDGKKIAIRGREKAVMLELRQDLLRCIEAEPDYTGNLGDIVVKKTQYYLPQFEKAAQGEKCRFNWTAFVFNGIFAYYRRSQEIFWRYYKWPLIISGVILLGIVGSGFFALKSLDSILYWSIAVSVLAMVIQIYLLVTNIRFGKNFNREYYQHCLIQAENTDASKRTAGTTVKNAVLFCVISSICASLIFAVAGTMLSVLMLGGASDDIWSDNIWTEDDDEFVAEIHEELLKIQCYDEAVSVILEDPTYVNTISFPEYEDGSPLSVVQLTASDATGMRTAFVSAACDYTYEGIAETFRCYFSAVVEVETAEDGTETFTVTTYYPDSTAYVLDDYGNEIPVEEWAESSNDRSTWSYEDYVNYYGVDPADYGYMWYNAIRSGPLDDFFESAIEEIRTIGNGSRLYEITNPQEANLTPDDFIGTWQTENGIVFTIDCTNGEYSIDFSENYGLDILGGWFSESIYNIEGDFCGMSGSYGFTSFSVSYSYSTEYPLYTSLELEFESFDGTITHDSVPLVNGLYY